MNRRAITLGLCVCLIAAPSQARRYRVYRRARTKPAPVIADPPPAVTVRTVRIIPLPGRLVPTFLDLWSERIGFWFR